MGCLKGSCVTLVYGLWWHQAKPTSDQSDDLLLIFIPSGWPCKKGHETLVGIWALTGFVRGVGRDEKHSFLRVEGKGGKENSCGVLAAGLESSEGMAGALCHAESILEGVLRDAPAIGAKKVA